MATYAFPAELFTVEGDPEAVRERTHVWQVRTYGYPDDDALARSMEDGAKATEAQWWDYYQMNQRP